MAEDTDSQEKATESEDASEKKPTRRDFLKITGSAVAGAVVGSKLSREKQPETEEKKEVVLRTEKTPTINDIFEVSTTLNSAIPEDDPLKEDLEGVISQDELVGKFLKASTVISTLMIDKHIAGRLSADEINTVTDAIMKLQGVDYKPESGETGPKASLERLSGTLKLRT